MPTSHIFFDLDHTLWDYSTNAKEALDETFETFNLSQAFTTSKSFIRSFHFHNDKLWHEYNHGKIDRSTIRNNRFQNILKGRIDPSDDRIPLISEFFISTCSNKTALIPGTIDTLEYLAANYPLGIISNGFNDIQLQKIENTGLSKFFKWVITSESAQCRKPSVAIFRFAESMSGASPTQAVMVGDNLKTDIAGALSADWKAIWFNPREIKEAHRPMITELKELIRLF